MLKIRIRRIKRTRVKFVKNSKDALKERG